MTALVVEADDPLDNRVTFGKSGLGRVRILVEAEPDPIYVSRDFKLDRDHWPVCGMHLPVTVDRANPESFEIRWDEVPSMAERAAANDPTLADPAGTKKRTLQALIASGATGPAGPNRPAEDVRDRVVTAQADAAAQAGTRLDHWEESLEGAAGAPAPTGKTRAVVLFAASEATLRTEDSKADGSGGVLVRERHGKHDVVLAVTIPGNEPYAVYVPRFDHKGGKGLAPGAGLPALVSSSDPSDIEILWDELPSVREQLRETVAEAKQLAQSSSAAAAAQLEDAIRLMSERAAAPTPSPQAPGGHPAITPEIRELMLRNAKMAISAATSPQMRRMIIEQYRLAGLPIDEKGNPAA
jgi:hypothetical protein